MKKQLLVNPLCEAVVNNDIDSFNALLASGVDVNGIDDNRLTALFYAADYGRIQMAEILLKKGANIECRDSFGNTPLMRACLNFLRYGVAMIHLLISYGADINAMNNYGVSPKGLSKTIMDFPEIEAFKD